MTYESYRKALIDSYYDHQLESLLSGFDPNRRTVIFLPGGMGSQLERTEGAYPKSPNIFTEIVWMDVGILGKFDAKTLEIESDEKDLQSHVIAPHGPLSFLNQTPYDELHDRARRRNWNYFVFGFDWRRPVADSALQFKNLILAFRDNVMQAHNVDPIPNLTIVCHSMGGMVCTDAMRDSQLNSLNFNAILTIATPFYGTSTHQDRYFVGIPGLMNTIYKAETVVRIVASLVGPYTLMFLPKAVYDRDGSKLGLSRYPERSVDGKDDNDPFDPKMMKRWPKAVRDHKQYLVRASNEMVNISQPISANIAPIFFNVRSSLDLNTAVEIYWNDIDGDTIVPGKSPSPLTGLAGPGDGTVPAWSAWHAHCLKKNRYELKQASDHGTLLEHKEVLDLVQSIVEKRKLPAAKKATRSPRPKVASAAEVENVVTDWANKKVKGEPLPRELFEKPVKRAIMSNLIAGTKLRMVAPGKKKPKKK